MTFSIDNPEGGCNNPPLGKYVREKPSGEQGLKYTDYRVKPEWKKKEKDAYIPFIALSVW